MPTTMYSIYAGHYPSPAIAKGDVVKINKLGLQGFVFSRGDHYALKVFSTPDATKADIVKKALEANGFTTELEMIDLTKNLHTNH